MKVQKLSHWVEIFANLAVVASVLFLSIEVRNNTKAIESQNIMERSRRLNQPFINSPLIPSILEKIKNVDGPEPGEAYVMNYYGLSYEEAGIWGRYVAEGFSGLEGEFIRNGPSRGLKDRIQLLFLFQDIILFWDSGHIQIQNPEFIEYVNEIRALPLSKKLSNYKHTLDSLKVQHFKTTDSVSN